MRLDKDVFFALAAIIWADGVVTDSEADALLGAARACGLTGADFEAVRAATKTRIGLDGVKALALEGEQRAFVYAIAAWLTRADGKVTVEETDALGKLGDLLELSDDDRACAIIASEAIGVFEDGAPHDVSTLAKELARAAAES